MLTGTDYYFKALIAVKSQVLTRVHLKTFLFIKWLINIFMSWVNNGGSSVSRTGHQHLFLVFSLKAFISLSCLISKSFDVCSFFSSFMRFRLTLCTFCCSFRALSSSSFFSTRVSKRLLYFSFNSSVFVFCLFKPPLHISVSSLSFLLFPSALLICLFPFHILLEFNSTFNYELVKQQ